MGGGTLGGTYLWELARELNAVPPRVWLRKRGAWPEVVRLAFRYLDCNGDGVLCPQDVVSHLVVTGYNRDEEEEGDAASGGIYLTARGWVARWMPAASANEQEVGLRPDHFRAVLLSSPAPSPSMGKIFCQLDMQEAESF